jgi:hypothetical protein
MLEQSDVENNPLLPPPLAFRLVAYETLTLNVRS